MTIRKREEESNAMKSRNQYSNVFVTEEECWTTHEGLQNKGICFCQKFTRYLLKIHEMEISYQKCDRMNSYILRPSPMSLNDKKYSDNCEMIFLDF